MSGACCAADADGGAAADGRAAGKPRCERGRQGCQRCPVLMANPVVPIAEERRALAVMSVLWDMPGALRMHCMVKCVWMRPVLRKIKT